MIGLEEKIIWGEEAIIYVFNVEKAGLGALVITQIIIRKLTFRALQEYNCCTEKSENRSAEKSSS